MRPGPRRSIAKSIHPGPWTGIAVLAIMAALGDTAGAADSIKALRRAVVKIHVTSQRENYAMPWQGGQMRSATGTGFLIKGKRILTNAHVVSDARFIQLQKDSDPQRYDARVLYIAHDCDLAMLEVRDPAFFEDTTTISFAKELPQLNDAVMVIGYPMGGDRISLTKGIVSRIDYSTYTHSGMDLHLVLQVDAAINPGNSGGPILFKNRVVGVAFQGLRSGDNIGYVIPMPVVRHFLDDVEDGVYNNYPELGVSFLTTRNRALRKHFKLPADRSGVVVSNIDPFGSATNSLKTGDILMSIDGRSIAADGTIDLDGNNVTFSELLERKQWGESAAFAIWRDGSALDVIVPLTNRTDPFIYKNIYDHRPDYYITGGLVFTPLNSEVLRAATGSGQSLLHYYSRYAKLDDLYKGRDEFVVLSRILPHEVNTYAGGFAQGIVERVNGKPIRRLENVKQALATPKDGFHVFEFAGNEEVLVLGVDAVAAANPRIAATYGVTEPEYFGGAE